MIHLLITLKKNLLKSIGILFVCMLAISLGACSNSSGQEEQTSKTRDDGGQNGGQICANPNNSFSACGSGSVDDPFLINDELQLVNLSDPANQAAAWDATACDGGQCHFKLIDDLNMDGMTLNGPIGTCFANRFHSNFDGNGHTISNLTINLPTTDYVGLFGCIGASAEIKNIGLVNTNISGQLGVGSLAGFNSGEITNSYVTGSVSSEDGHFGGFVGFNSGDISNSYANVSVTNNGGGELSAGGFAGSNQGGSITNSYSTGSVTSNGDGRVIGALVGLNADASIINSYATGAITTSGGISLGGLVGNNNWDGNITDSYSTSSITGASLIGGLVGIATPNSNTNGTNYFVDNTGTDGLGTGTCTGTCTQQSLADIRDTFDESAAPLNWDPATWGALGEAGSFPCLRNMPSGAPSCP